MGTTLLLIPPSCPTSFNTSKKKGKASQKQLLQDNLSWEKNPQKWSCRLCRRPDKWMGATVRRKRPKSPKHCVAPWEPADFDDVSAHLFQKDYFTNCTCIVLLLSPTKHAAFALLFASSKFSLKLNSKFMQANPSQASTQITTGLFLRREACLLQKHFIRWTLWTSTYCPVKPISTLRKLLIANSPTPPSLSSPVPPSFTLTPAAPHWSGTEKAFHLLLLSFDANFAYCKYTQSKTAKTRRYLTSNGISQVRVWNSYQIAIIVLLLPVISSNRLYFHLLKKKIHIWEESRINFSWNRFAK